MKCPNRTCYFETEKGRKSPDFCPLCCAKMPKRIRIDKTKVHNVEESKNKPKVVQLEDDTFSVYHWQNHW